MKKLFLLFMVFSILFIAGCPSRSETMILLDEKINRVNISISNGTSGINDEHFLSFDDEDTIHFFHKAITTAKKGKNRREMTDPDYDVMIEYEGKEGSLPTHGIHLWLGEEDEESIFMYIEDDTAYHTTAKITKELRSLILP